MRLRPCASPHPMLPWLMPMMLAMAGGSLEIESAPGKGTVLLIRIPS